MLKEVTQSFFGIILILGGVYLLYLYVSSLNNNANPLFLGLSILLIAGGVFLLIRAGKSDTVILKRTAPDAVDETQPLVVNEETPSNQLEKNNEMLAQWKKTNDTRTMMKMLEISSGDKESNK